MGKPFSIRERLKSFVYAAKGIAHLCKTEHNFRIHLAATVLVIGLGAWFGLSRTEWLWLVLAIGFVLVAEAFNSAIERLVDLKQPDHDPKAGLIKDLAAGAVLLAAITAAFIGGIIFWPYLGLT